LAVSKLEKLRYIDEHNTNLVTGYRFPEFVGVSEIAPIIDTTQEAGKFPKFGPEAMMVYPEIRRPFMSPRVRINQSMSYGSYTTDEVGVEVAIYDRERRAVPEKIRPRYEENKVKLGEQVIQLWMEYSTATILQDPSRYAAGCVEAITGANQWRDKINSDPWADMTRWLTILKYNVGKEFKDLSIALGAPAMLALIQHPATIDRFARGTVANEVGIANMLGCRSVRMFSGMYVTEMLDAEDPDSAVMTDLWGDVALAYYKVDDPQIGDPVAAAIPRVEGAKVVTEYRDERHTCDIKAVDDNFGFVQVSNRRLVFATGVSGASTATPPSLNVQ
jgi:hypothetical protein